MQYLSKDKIIDLLAQLPRLKRIHSRKFKLIRESFNVKGRIITYTFTVKAIAVHVTANYVITYYVGGEIVEVINEQESKVFYFSHCNCIDLFKYTLRKLDIGL